jgi:transposase
MAMGAAKGDAATLQVEIVCLDELVPSDDRYRRLDELVDWSFVREAAAPYYAEEGRPSLDPIVLVKLALCGALEGIGSARELLRVAAMRLDLRRFLGYGFADRLPVHQTISHAHTRRFVDAGLFERLFARSVCLCREHDLIDGTHLSIDGFHVEANAALQSLRASLALAAAPADDDDCAEDADGPPEPTGRPQLALAEPRSGPTPKIAIDRADVIAQRLEALLQPGHCLALRALLEYGGRACHCVPPYFFGKCRTSLVSSCASRCGQLPSAAQVFWPTIPSTSSRPKTVWNSLTALSVFGPKSPSMSPGSKPLSIRSCCSNVTAGPLEPFLTVGGSSLAQVLGPTIPSTAKPRNDWYNLTAFSVLAPKMPSTRPESKPRKLRFSCALVTASPLEPFLITGCAMASPFNLRGRVPVSLANPGEE